MTQVLWTLNHALYHQRLLQAVISRETSDITHNLSRTTPVSLDSMNLVRSKFTLPSCNELKLYSHNRSAVEMPKHSDHDTLTRSDVLQCAQIELQLGPPFDSQCGDRSVELFGESMVRED